MEEVLTQQVVGGLLDVSVRWSHDVIKVCVQLSVAIDGLPERKEEGWL